MAIQREKMGWMAVPYGPYPSLAAGAPHVHHIGPRQNAVAGAVPALNSGHGTALALVHQSPVCVVDVVGLAGDSEDDLLFVAGFDCAVF